MYPLLQTDELAGTDQVSRKKFQLDDFDDHLLLVPSTRVPKRHTTGRLINSLTFSAQHTK